jgi:cyanophycinase
MPDQATLAHINHLLMQSGPKLTDPDGLPGRPWFKNQIYAPGAYTGYEAKPMAGVLEAMDQKDWATAESQIPRVAQAIQRETAVIDEATQALRDAQKKLGYAYFVMGTPEDSSVKPSPGVALMGGGTDQDAAFQWLCAKASGGNFVVLRASGSADYNPYVAGLCPALSAVETLVIASREGAQQPFVIDRIRHANALFISGGSQDNYINFWQGTPVQTSINQLIARGVPFGGTSAGLAVLGEYNFSALHDTIQSKEALANPSDPRITIGRGFLTVPNLEGKITDSHFVARDRMGRLMVFLARISADNPSQPYGIGIDEKTAVLMNPDGSASVVGSGNAYFLRPSIAPAKDVSVYRLSPGSGRFNIATWIGSGGTSYKLSAANGTVKSTLPGGSLY